VKDATGKGTFGGTKIHMPLKWIAVKRSSAHKVQWITFNFLQIPLHAAERCDMNTIL
jgi:hypothetical protein